MKNVVLILGISTIFLFACSNTTETKTQVEELSKVEISIDGMTCEGCEKAITSNVEMLNVNVVGISFQEGMALVEFDSSKVSIDQITSKIENTGYNVTGTKPVE